MKSKGNQVIKADSELLNAAGVKSGEKHLKLHRINEYICLVRL